MNKASVVPDKYQYLLALPGESVSVDDARPVVAVLNGYGLQVTAYAGGPFGEEGSTTKLAPTIDEVVADGMPTDVPFNIQLHSALSAVTTRSSAGSAVVKKFNDDKGAVETVGQIYGDLVFGQSYMTDVAASFLGVILQQPKFQAAIQAAAKLA